MKGLTPFEVWFWDFSIGNFPTVWNPEPNPRFKTIAIQFFKKANESDLEPSFFVYLIKY